MIPILFEHDATSFEGHGLGELVDCTACVTKVDDTGQFELELTYPMKTRLFEELKINRIIAAQAYPNNYPLSSDMDRVQAFRIYGYEKTLNGLCRIKAQHITYDMSNIIICPTDRSTYPEYRGECVVGHGWMSASDLVNCINNNRYNNYPVIVYGTNPFTLSASGYPPINNLTPVSTDPPRSLRSILFDSSDSLLANFGGIVLYNNYQVYFRYEPTSSVKTTIEYGMNLINFEQEENISEMYTGILPYAITKDYKYDNDKNWNGPESIMYGDVIYADGNFDRQRILPVDLSEHFTKDTLSYSGASGIEGMPKDKSEVNYIANLWFKENDIGVPEVNLTLNYAQLPHEAPIYLYDLVRIKFIRLGVDTLARVCSYTFDVLNERCAGIEIGKSKASITQRVLYNDYSRKNKMLG